MRNDFRKDLLENLTRLACELGNPSNFNAYPQLQYVFFNLGATLDTLAKSVIREDIEDKLYGRTPWAKLYEIQTGHTVEIEPLMVGGVLPNSIAMHYVTPLKEIVDYWFEYRGKLAPSDELVSSTFDIGEWLVIVDYNTFSATAEKPMNDMVVTIDDITMSLAHVSCPLFHESIEITMADGWMAELRRKVLERFVKPEDITHDFDQSKVINQKYFGTLGAARTELPEDHPYFKLYHLLESSTYGDQNRSVCTVPLNADYSVTLSSCHDWGCVQNKNVRIGTVYRHIERDDGSSGQVTMPNWMHHHLLVKDIVDNIDSIIDSALAIHRDQVAGL